MSNRIYGIGRALVLASLLGAAAALAGCTEDNGTVAVTSTGSQFLRTNLVASKAGYLDSAGPATTTDPSLLNPWGVAFSPTGPFWIADNHSGLSTIYNSSGVKQGLVVNIASPSGPTGGAATGQVFNGTSDFAGTHFIFSTEDGTIVGWASGTGTTVEANRSGAPGGAIYKGLAMGASGGNNFLYATNFHSGNVDVFDKNFAFVKSFTDPSVDPGFAPFGIQNINGQLYVTFAKQDADKEDDVAGVGNGFVDIFDTSGNLVRRFSSKGTLNSPWGVVQAPASFGKFANAILIGNFGDGTIGAFSPISGSYLGSLVDSNGAPITISGLWALIFGNGGTGGDKNALYFTAGIDTGGGVESGGLFGRIVPKP